MSNQELLALRELAGLWRLPSLLHATASRLVVRRLSRRPFLEASRLTVPEPSCRRSSPRPTSAPR